MVSFLIWSRTSLTNLICVVTGACYVVSAGGCSKENQNTIDGKVRAPGVPYEAVIFQRPADQFRSATVNISIVQAGMAPLNDIGNIYSASRESEVSAQKLWLNWRSSDNLQIFRNPETHSYKEDKNFDCMTGVFVQTTPFKIEYGDIKDIKTDSPAPAKVKVVKSVRRPKGR